MSALNEMQMLGLLSSVEQALCGEATYTQRLPVPCAELPTQSKVMIVDDEELNILVVAEHLRDGGYPEPVYTVDASQALALATQERPDVVLLDLHMPRLSGFDLLGHIRSDPALGWTPVVVLTSSTSATEKLRALELGATDFLPKPVHGGELLARLRNILLAKAYHEQLRDHSRILEAEVRQRTADLEASRQEAIHCLARAGEFRDDDTGHHVIRVGRYARLIGQGLGMDERALDMLEHAAKLHDIGKIGIPDAILLKVGKLTAQEFEIMRRHSTYGKEILAGMQEREPAHFRACTQASVKIVEAARSPTLSLATTIALTHHERWAGNGYPLGLAGEDIPLEGRITAVADVFDALSSRRSYKPAFPLDRCLDILREGRGLHFDPYVLDVFLARMDDIAAVQKAYSDPV